MLRTVTLGPTTVDIESTDGDRYLEHFHDSQLTTLRAVAAQCVDESSTVVDIGANIGLTAIALAQLVPRGRVLAVEANPTLAALLDRNVERAGVRDIVTVASIALGETAGRAVFFANPDDPSGAFLADVAPTAVTTAHEPDVVVPVTTLDALLAEHAIDTIDFVKLDVEGAELRVLHGAAETLKRAQPTVQTEFNLFTLTSFGRVLPLDFVSELFDVFPLVYVAHADGRVASLGRDQSYELVHDTYRDGALVELVGAFRALESRAPWRPGTSEHRIRRDALEHEVVTLRGELADVQASTSWRVTRPLRAVSDALQKLSARGAARDRR